MYSQDDGNSNEAANNMQDEKLDEYIRRLLEEKALINGKDCPFAQRFIDEEINRAQQKLIRGPSRDTRYIDVYNERLLKVSVKVLFPLKEHPGFNFVGKLLGPKGSNLKQLQENTRCFMNIHGRGSMRDREREEELRRSCEPKYAHLTEDLHIEISALAPPAEAHSRISAALCEIRKHLIPEYDPSQEEEGYPMHQQHFDNVDYPKPEWSRRQNQNDDRNFRGRGGMGYPKPEWSRRPNQNEDRSPNMRGRGRGFQRGAPRSRMNTNTSVMSILNKARIAMEESYGYQDGPEQDYDNDYGNHDVNSKKRKF